MKDIKWYTWVGMALLFIIATVVFVKVFGSIDRMAHSDTMNVHVESEEIDHQIQMETETKEAGSLTSVKSIPFTQHKDIDEPIKKWANKKEDNFFTEMHDTDVLMDHNTSAHFSVESKVKPLTEDLYHVSISSEQTVEKETSEANVKTFTIDLNKKKLTGLSRIMEDEFTTGKLYNLLKIYSEEKLNNEKFHETYEKLDDIDWTFGKENMVFYIKPEITKDKERKITVPLTAISSYLKEDYYSSLISKELDKQIQEKKEKERQKKEKEQQAKHQELQEKKLVALTFDDGPHPEQTVRILNTLQQYDAKATFFSLASNVEQNPEVAKRIVEDGHELANHSMSHANLNAVDEDKARTEIFDSQAVINENTGQKPSLFRPPYGNFQDSTETLINESGQDIVLWSVDTHDWEKKNANSIYQTVKAHTVPGSIILMHDLYPTTADALPKILKYFNEQGYETVTISELQPYIQDTYNGAYFGN